jgi:hypothetical protein
MKYKKITVETDGTTANTKIFIDDKQVGMLQHFDISADVNDVFVNMNAKVARMVNGKPKIKKIKVRDSKTLKFVEKEMMELEPIFLERA